MNHDAASRAAVLRKIGTGQPTVIDGSAGGTEPSCMKAQIVMRCLEICSGRLACKTHWKICDVRFDLNGYILESQVAIYYY